MITLKFCTIDVRDGAVWTTFPDGTSSANWLLVDDGSFAAIARDCGFQDPGLYLLAHEVCHALVPETFFDRPSYVVSMAAQGRKASIAGAKAEERLIYLVQRAAAGAIPIIDPQWAEVIARLRTFDLCGDPAVARGERAAA